MGDTAVVDTGSYASNYLLLRPNYSATTSAAAGPSSNTSAGTPAPVGSSPASPVAGPSSGGAGTAAGLMLEDVSPAGRSGSSSSAHHLVQHHQQHFQQQQPTSSSSEEIKRDLSDMCGGQPGQQDMSEPDETDQQHKEAQYLSANCVVFMSYSGDTASVVDQHFSRALNHQQTDGSYTEAAKSSGASLAKGESVRYFFPSFKIAISLITEWTCIHPSK